MASSSSPDVSISFSIDPRSSVHPPPTTYNSVMLDHSNHEVFNVSYQELRLIYLSLLTHR